MGESEPIYVYDITVSNENILESLGIELYPNIIRQGEELLLNNNSKNTFSFSMHNVSGQEIYQGEIKEGEHIINTAVFSAGVYFMSVIHEGNNYAQKIIIQ